MRTWKRFIPSILLLLILILSAVTRLYELGIIPPGLVDDEANKGYDAYSLLKTGRDQWGQPWPLLAFKGFGDYRSPLYTYIALPFVKLFSLTPFAIRLPSALFGVLTVLLTYFLVHELLREKLIEKNRIEFLALASSLLLSLSPWHIGMSRMAMEVTVSVCFMVFAIIMILRSRRIEWCAYVAGVVMGLSVYIYPTNIMMVPFVFILITVFYREDIWGKYRKRIIVPIIITTLFAIPLLLYTSTSPNVRLQQVNLTRDSGLVDIVNEKRGACRNNFSESLCRIAFNKYIVYSEKFILNYFHHFSPNLLSIHGTTSQYSILPLRGLLYIVEFPLFLIGIFVVLKWRKPGGYFILFYLLFSAIPDSVTSDGHYGRFFISFPTWQIIISIGLYEIYVWSKKRLFLIVIIALLYITEVGIFTLEYLSYFPRHYSVYSHYGYRELIKNIDSLKYTYDKIVVSSEVNDAKQYIFYLFFTQYNPEQFQQEKYVERIIESNGWVRVKRIENIFFMSSLASMLLPTAHNDKVLLIGAPNEFPKTYIPSIFSIKDKKGDELFRAVDRKDLQYCTENFCHPTQ